MPNTKKIILIVDDSKLHRDFIALITKDCFPGFKIETREDGRAGLDFFTENQDRIALVITDYQMPYMDGLTLIKFIRSRDKSPVPVSIILISGFSDEKLRHSGADAFILKDIKLDLKTISDSVKNLLAQKKLVSA